MTTLRLCTFLVPRTTTERRMAGVPRAGELFFDLNLKAIFYGDGETPGGVRMPIGTEWLNGTVDNIPVFDASGRLQDSGRSIGKMVTGPTSSRTGNLPTFADDTGTALRDSGKPVDRLVTGPTISKIGNIVIFADDEGKTIKDSHWPSAMLVSHGFRRK